MFCENRVSNGGLKEMGNGYEILVTKSIGKLLEDPGI
jgi:hypothetical protein